MLREKNNILLPLHNEAKINNPYTINKKVSKASSRFKLLICAILILALRHMAMMWILNVPEEDQKDTMVHDSTMSQLQLEDDDEDDDEVEHISKTFQSQDEKLAVAASEDFEQVKTETELIQSPFHPELNRDERKTVDKDHEFVEDEDIRQNLDEKEITDEHHESVENQDIRQNFKKEKVEKDHEFVEDKDIRQNLDEKEITDEHHESVEKQDIRQNLNEKEKAEKYHEFVEDEDIRQNLHEKGITDENRAFKQKKIVEQNLDDRETTAEVHDPKDLLVPEENRTLTFDPDDVFYWTPSPEIGVSAVQIKEWTDAVKVQFQLIQAYQFGGEPLRDFIREKKMILNDLRDEKFGYLLN